jgi:Zn-dependent protease with chaperone function
MTSILQSAQLFVLAGASFLAIGSLVSALLAQLFRAQLSGSEPCTRHRALLCLALLPVFAAGALLLAASLPSLVALAVPRLDHCLTHDDGHAHLCFVHLPKLGVRPTLLLTLVFCASYVMIRAGFAAAGMIRATRVVGALIRTGEHRCDLGVIVIESPGPIGFAAGLIRPRVLLSRGLLDSLSEQECAVVLAHERAHVRRRDALVTSIVRALCVFQLPPTKRWLLSELEIAAEQVCDEEAAALVGDRVSVAATILTVERAAHHAVPPFGSVAVAFGQRAVERRVESLLASPKRPRTLRAPAAWLIAAVVALLTIADKVHHLTESALSFIAY